MVTKEEIRSIFEELFAASFKKHEESMIKYLSGSTQLLKQELVKINKTLHEMENGVKNNKNNIEDLRQSLEFTQDLLDGKHKEQQKEMEEKIQTLTEHIEGKYKEHENAVKGLKEQARRFEDRNR